MAGRGVAVVIEDDDNMRSILSEVLSQSGFAVHSASSGQEGVDAVRVHDPDLITMDVGLPDFDGLEASRRIRTFSNAYLIIVTGYAEEADAVMGFEAGADDVVTKPFRAREFRARIGAVMRRSRPLASVTDKGREAVHSRSVKPAGKEIAPARGRLRGEGSAASSRRTWDFAHNGLTLQENSRLAAVDGVPVNLTRTQFDLLLALMENGRTVLSRADLVRRLRNEPCTSESFVGAGEERAVEVHLGNLRKRLGDSSRRPRWVETVRGVGYRLAQ